MKPILFECSKSIPKSGEDICKIISDVNHWTEFKEYGILPGVKMAKYEKRTEEIVGSIIVVENTDGSGHVEEITNWIFGK